MKTAPPPTLSSRQLWMAALKLPMYSVAIMPIVLGSAVAYWETQRIDWSTAIAFGLAAILILVWENLCNDVFDAATGIDRRKYHSLVNLTGQRRLLFWLAQGCLVAGLALITAIAQEQGWVMLGLILACCGLGYLYQGPPFRLGYHGLGELLCFPAFGPLAVSAAYFSQTGRFSETALLASISLGISTTLVLFCSHFHQAEDDLAAGKRSPIVRLGTARAAQVLPWACGLTLAAIAGPIIAGAFPVQTAIALVSVLPARNLCGYLRTWHAEPSASKNAKFLAIHFQFWSGLLLSLGFAIAVWMQATAA